MCLDGQRGRGVKKKDKDATANVDMDVDVNRLTLRLGVCPNAIDVCVADAGAWQCLGRAH